MGISSVLPIAVLMLRGAVRLCSRVTRVVPLFMAVSLTPNEITIRGSSACARLGATSRASRVQILSEVSRRTPRLYVVRGSPRWWDSVATRPTLPGPVVSPSQATKESPNEADSHITTGSRHDFWPPSKSRKDAKWPPAYPVRYRREHVYM